MKCPIITAGFWADPNASGKDAVDCLKDQCEWWKETSQLCVLNRLAGELYSLVEVMEEIRDKLEALAKATWGGGQ